MSCPCGGSCAKMGTSLHPGAPFPASGATDIASLVGGGAAVAVEPPQIGIPLAAPANAQPEVPHTPILETDPILALLGAPTSAPALVQQYPAQYTPLTDLHPQGFVIGPRPATEPTMSSSVVSAVSGPAGADSPKQAAAEGNIAASTNKALHPAVVAGLGGLASVLIL